MKWILYIVALSFALTLPFTASAKIPPMSKKRLLQQADLVVEGTVVSVKNDGTSTTDHCYTWQAKRASFKISKVLKGKPGVTVIGLKFKTRIKSEKKCVGGATSYALQAGTTWQLYLREVNVGTRSRHYVFINWNGVNELKK